MEAFYGGAVSSHDLADAFMTCSGAVERINVFLSTSVNTDSRRIVKDAFGRLGWVTARELGELPTL